MSFYHVLRVMHFLIYLYFEMIRQISHAVLRIKSNSVTDNRFLIHKIYLFAHTTTIIEIFEFSS